MKKYVIGLVMGVVLTFSMSAMASDIVGKLIDTTLPLIVNGEKSETDVIVIEGTSYLPVRAAGEMLGLHVDFREGHVILEEEGVSMSTTEIPTPDIDQSIRIIESEIETLKISIHHFDSYIEMVEKQESMTEQQKINKKLYEEKSAELKVKLAELEKQKADLEASK